MMHKSNKTRESSRSSQQIISNKILTKKIHKSSKKDKINNKDQILNKENKLIHYVNPEILNQKLMDNQDQSNGKRIDFSDDISLDQVERKLNRFSIARDSLESSLANLPYSIEVIFSFS